MAKKKYIPTKISVKGPTGSPLSKKKTPTTKDNVVDTEVTDSTCPDIDDTPDVKEILIEEPTLLELTCPKIDIPEGVDPQLFQATMQPLIRKISNLVKFSEMQLCLFSKFVENSNTKIIEKEVCLIDGTKGCKQYSYNAADGSMTLIQLLDSLGDPTELEVVPCPEILINYVKTCNKMAEIKKKCTTHADESVTVEYILVGTATLADGTALEDGALLSAAQFAELTTCPVTDIITKDVPLCYQDPASEADPKETLQGNTCIVIPTVDGVPDYANQTVNHFDVDNVDITAEITDGTLVKVTCASVNPPQIETCVQCIQVDGSWEERKLHTVYTELDDGTFDTSKSFVTDMSLVPTEDAIADLVKCPIVTYETITTCEPPAGEKVEATIASKGRRKKKA